MRLSRLLQRAGAIGAASVALFVSLIGTAYASTAPQVNVYGVDTVTNADGHFEARYHFQRRFASNDPNYPGKVDYITKKIRVEKRGNPMKWVKRNGLEVAVIGAVAAAGYVIDELSNQVSRPVFEDVYPDGYEPGYYWGVNSNYGATPHEPASQWCQSIFGSGVNAVIGEGTSSKSFNCVFSSSGIVATSGTVYRLDCNGSTSGHCTPLMPTSMQTGTEFVPYSEVWDIINPIADAHPEALRDWAVDPAGNPYIYPEVAAEHAKIIPDVTGAPALPDAVVVNDPLEGQGLDPTGYPTGEPSPTPEVASETPPLELPTDYAREDTLKDVRDWLKQQIETKPDVLKDAPADKMYEPLTQQFETLPDLPALLTPGDFGIQSTQNCETITFEWRGASVVFPSHSQCQKLNDAKQILGWLIYVLTFFGCVYTVLGARSLKA